jgi:hypothetical protein
MQAMLDLMQEAQVVSLGDFSATLEHARILLVWPDDAATRLRLDPS